MFDLSSNNLGPIIPNFFWTNFSRLSTLRLSSNNFSELELPNTIVSTPRPGVIELQNNNFSGGWPNGLMLMMLRTGMKWFVFVDHETADGILTFRS
jgi:hypothetical protein